jgi:hypothetical protein
MKTGLGLTRTKLLGCFKHYNVTQIVELQSKNLQKN